MNSNIEIKIPEADRRYSVVSFIFKLAPLINMINNGKKRAGRDCKKESIVDARNAFYQLIINGEYHAKGASPEKKLRKVLKIMTEGKNPILENLEKRDTIYFVSPGWSKVRKALRDMLSIENDEGEDINEVIRDNVF